MCSARWIVNNFLKIYFLYIKIFFKARAEYKIPFIFGVFSNFYRYFINFALFWVIVNKFSDIAGWNFAEMSVLFGLNLFTYSISGVLIWFTVYHLGITITEGRLDQYLTRPMSIIGQMICQRFGDTFIGQIIVTVFFLSMAFYELIDQITLKISVYLILSIIGGVFIQCGAMIIIGSISFWTSRSIEMGEIFYYNLRRMTNYPLTIYPKWIKVLLTYIFPWAFINYYPSIIILNKPSSRTDSMLGWFSPLVGVFILMLSFIIFKQGLKRYDGSGH